jgi:tRNA(Ile2) C34 agmatinyltransferase TiaS
LISYFSITDNLPNRFLYKDIKTIKISDGILTEGKKDVKVREHLRFHQIAQKDFFIVCPICESTMISKRRRKKPKYRCQKCFHVFDDPRAKMFFESRNEKNDVDRMYSDLFD